MFDPIFLDMEHDFILFTRQSNSYTQDSAQVRSSWFLFHDKSKLPIFFLADLPAFSSQGKCVLFLDAPVLGVRRSSRQLQMIGRVMHAFLAISDMLVWTPKKWPSITKEKLYITKKVIFAQTISTQADTHNS